MVLGLGLAGLGILWDTVSRREKEAELLFVGDQYRRAIARYHSATPGPEKQYPRRLEDLLADPRFPNTVRHLRRLYRDPVANSPTWGLVKEGEGIVGVHSLSERAPFKRAGFPTPYEGFAEAPDYRAWVFKGPDQAGGATLPSSGVAQAGTQAGTYPPTRPASNQPASP